MLQNKIRRGELDRSVTFIKRVTIRGVSNQDEVTSWVELPLYPTVFARKVEARGSEVVIGDQVQYIQKTIFTIVYRTDLITQHRLVSEGRVYEIISITETGARKTYLDVVANLLDAEVWT